MAEKQKLIDLLEGFSFPVTVNGEPLSEWTIPMPQIRKALADHLLASGVTFATDTNVGSKWISVEDRLPELEKYKLSKLVLAWIPDHGRCFALRYDNGKGEQWFSGGVEQPDITHWMPLPEPPKEG